MNTEVRDWLVQEISEVLDAGPVGLYEFLWTLRGGRLGLQEGELREYASAALEQLLATGAGELVWLRWPESTPVATAHGVALDSASWNDPPEAGCYLALTRL